VKVVRHQELSAKYPDAVGNLVTVKLKDGRMLTKRVDHACGHAKNRMSDDGVRHKFHRLADPVLSRARADAVVVWVESLDSAMRVDDLFPLLEVND
jgi:2-methylcitrate dehydratase PrpD